MYLKVRVSSISNMCLINFLYRLVYSKAANNFQFHVDYICGTCFCHVIIVVIMLQLLNSSGVQRFIT